ncbi:hypothetical protein [Spongiibacter sp.]
MWQKKNAPTSEAARVLHSDHRREPQPATDHANALQGSELPQG